MEEAFCQKLLFVNLLANGSIHELRHYCVSHRIQTLNETQEFKYISYLQWATLAMSPTSLEDRFIGATLLDPCRDGVEE